MVRSIIALFVSLTIATPVFAAGFARVGTFGYTYDGMFTGVRQTSLGHADLAGAYGPTATQINTAPLPVGDSVEASYDRNPFLASTGFEIFGAVAEYRGLRVGFTRFRWFTDPRLVRTAYNPEGTGETFDAGDDIDVLSLGYDLGRHLDEDGGWAWTIGAAWRRYQGFLAENSIDEDTWDVGTTVGWTTPHPYGRARLAAAVSWQNVSNREFDWDGRRSGLPASIRGGVTLEATFGNMDWGTEAFRFLMAISRRNADEKWFGGETHHLGLEATGAGIFAARAGFNSRLTGDLNSWGLGLVLDQDFMGPFTASADFGQYKTYFEWVDMYSLRARYSF